MATTEPEQREPFGVEVICSDAFHGKHPQRIATFMRAFDGSASVVLVHGGRRNADGSLKRPGEVQRQVIGTDGWPMQSADAEGVVRFRLPCRCGLSPVRTHDSIFPIIDKLLRSGIDKIPLRALS
jgi:hypothetical protein